MNADQLKPEEFEQHLRAGTLRLAFIGMSNAGKSYRAKILQDELGFYWYEVDTHIQQKLQLEDVQDLSSWLGYPTLGTYASKAQIYLAAEEESTHLAELDTGGKNLVFDTTGSVIYLSAAAQAWLRGECLVIHIDVGEASMVEMVERYFKEPKPVLWGDAFNRLEGEGAMDALRRCYPKLLQYRLHHYRELAHLTIPLAELYDTTALQTLGVIKSKLH